jgi:hypothetical protein
MKNFDIALPGNVSAQMIEFGLSAGVYKGTLYGRVLCAR